MNNNNIDIKPFTNRRVSFSIDDDSNENDTIKSLTMKELTSKTYPKDVPIYYAPPNNLTYNIQFLQKTYNLQQENI